MGYIYIAGNQTFLRWAWNSPKGKDNVNFALTDGQSHALASTHEATNHWPMGDLNEILEK